MRTKGVPWNSSLFPSAFNDFLPFPSLEGGNQVTVICFECVSFLRYSREVCNLFSHSSIDIEPDPLWFTGVTNATTKNIFKFSNLEAYVWVFIILYYCFLVLFFNQWFKFFFLNYLYLLIASEVELDSHCLLYRRRSSYNLQLPQK